MTSPSTRHWVSLDERAYYIQTELLSDTKPIYLGGVSIPSTKQRAAPVLWEGNLVPESVPIVADLAFDSAAAAADKEAQAAKPWGRIGDPEMWPISKILSNLRSKKAPPFLKGDSLTPNDQAALIHKLKEADFYLLRLDCSFRLDAPDPPRVRLDHAEFTVKLRPRGNGVGPVVYDLDPKSVTQPVKHSTEWGLSPALTVDKIEASPGGVKKTISYDQLVPTITGSGAGLAEATWDFRRFKDESIAGSRRMYLIIKAPKGMQKGIADFNLRTRILVRDKWEFLWKPDVPPGESIWAQIWPTVKRGQAGS